MQLCRGLSRAVARPHVSRVVARVHPCRYFETATLKDVLAAQAANAGRFIDVREVEAFRDAHAEGFVNVPSSEVATTLASASRSERVFLIDHYGYYSEKAARVLETAGFGDVKVVDGGLLYWTFQGGPLASENSALASRLRRVEGGDKVTVAAAEASAAELGVSVDLSDRLFPLLDVHMTDAADRQEAITKSAAKRK